jgi:hypothetical protein
MDRHHNAPPLAERLEIDHETLAQQVADALALEALPPIFGDDDLVPYSERAKALKAVAGAVEKSRKAEKDQILKDGRTIDGFFANLAEPVKKAADAIVAAINAHQRRMLEEKRKAEEAARREAEERAKAEATPFDDPVPTPAPVVPIRAAEAARVVGSGGRVTATAQTVWKAEVTDPAAVPRQFLMVNEAAIKAAVAGGMREIPGVRIFEDVRTVVR